MIVKNLLNNLGMFEGIVYELTQLFKNIVANCVDLILTVGIARFSSEIQSGTRTTCLILFVVLRTGSKTSLATNARGYAGGKS